MSSTISHSNSFLMAFLMPVLHSSKAADSFMISHIALNTIQQIDPISKALSSFLAASLASIVARNDELVRSELENVRSIFFVCLVGATVAVFAGVAFEEGEELMHAVRRVLPLDPMTVYRWAKRLTRAGWILIVIGVAGEGIFEVYVSRADGILATFDNILLNEARKESSGAVIGAAAANVQVAEARKRTAELEKESAELRAENLRLEAIIAPRSLSLDQQQKIADACRKFHGHGVMVKSYGTDGEGSALAGQIIAVLKAADIVVADDRGSEIVAGEFDSGVHVRAPDAEVPFANAIADALSTIGHLTVFPVNDPEPHVGAMMVGGGQSFTNPNAVFVTIRVGIKPLPILTSATKTANK